MINIDFVLNDSNSTSTGTYSVPITSQDQVVLIFTAGNGGITPTLTLNGVSLTALTTIGTPILENVYYINNPPMGMIPVSYDVSPTSGFDISILVISGVNKSIAKPNATSASYVSAVIPVNVPYAQSMLFTWISTFSGNLVTPGPEQTMFHTSSTSGTLGAYQYGYGNLFVNYGGTSTSGVIATISLPPAKEVSIWNPNVDQRSMFDAVGPSSIKDTRSFTNQTQYYGPQYYLNSFLHTIGRGPGLATPQTNKIISVFDSSAVTESVQVVIPTISEIISDSSTVTESVTVQIRDFVSVSDSSTVTESVTVQIGDLVSVSDSSVVTDTVTVTLVDTLTMYDPTQTWSQFESLTGGSSPSGWSALGNTVWTFSASGISYSSSGSIDPNKFLYTNTAYTQSGIIVEADMLINNLGSGDNRIGITILGGNSDGKGVNLIWHFSDSGFKLLDDGIAYGPGTISASPVVGDIWRLKGYYDGTTFWAKAWLSTTPEPGAWQMSWVHTPSVSYQYAGLTGDSSSGAANATWKNFSVNYLSTSSPVTENVQMLMIDNINVFDSSAVTESVTVQIPAQTLYTISVSDSSAVTDAVVQVLEIDNINASDSSTVVDVITVVVPMIPENVFDSSVVTDVPTVEIVDLVTVFDSSAVTDSTQIQISNTISVFDASTATDNLVQIELIDMDQIFDSSTVTEFVAVEIVDFVSVFDSSTVTDSVTIEIIDPLIISDSSTATDVVTQMLITNFISVFDSSTVTENIQVEIVDLVTVFDSSAVTDSVTVAALLAGVSVFDSSTVTENVVMEIIDSVNVFDSSTVTDSVSITIPIQLSVSDSSTVSENVQVEIVNNISIFDNSTITEAITIFTTDFFSVFDTSTVTENIQIEIVDFVSVSDSSTVTDVISQTMVTNNVSVSDSSIVTDAVTIFIPILYISVEDDSAATDALVIESQEDTVIFDSSTVTDSVELTLSNFVSVSDSSTVSESFIVAPYYVTAVSDNSVVTEFVQVEIFDFETIFDASTVTDFTQIEIVNNIVIFDSSTVTDVVGAAAANNIVIFDNSTVTDVLTGQNGGIYLNPIDITVYDRVGKDALLILVEGRLAYLVVEGVIPYYVWI